MKQQKTFKNALKPKRQDSNSDTFHHGKSANDKVKYRHMGHWLEEEEDYVVEARKKKKVTT